MRCTIMKWWTPIAVLAVGMLALPSIARAKTTIDFEDLTLASESYWNGSDGSGGFTTSQGVGFNNNYNATWGSWDGWSYSNKTDITSTGTAGQYTAYANVPVGGGEGGSSNYGVAYVGWADPPTIMLPTPGRVCGAYFTNNAYAYDSMLNGDAFAKKFGGGSGNDKDWFLLTITGKDTGGAVTNAVDFYLADYQYNDNSLDYIVDQWEWINLSILGEVKTLEFELDSSDTGAWGMNTPAYFAMDGLCVDVASIPEPSTVALALSGTLALLWWWRRRRNA